MGQDGGREVTTRLFGYFLTWMQEKKGAAFVVATANDITKLPPELMRKGRFDEIFYVGFPNESERRKIFEIHIGKRRKSDLGKININELISKTDGYSGADIEGVVREAIEFAFAENKQDISTQDILSAIKDTHSLSEIMKEPLEKMKKEYENRKFKKLLSKFVKSYSRKESKLSDIDWLASELKTELPDLTDADAKKIASEAIETISDYDKNYKSLNLACSQGESKEQWFAENVANAAIGTSVVDHVNNFNMQSTLTKSKFVAEVCVPEPGQTYGLNSFDSIIKDSDTGKILHQYQFKYGADAKTTIRLIQDGNYNNQRIVVPAEQVDEVRKAFPGKSIEAYIGGTEKCPIKSESLTKQQATSPIKLLYLLISQRLSK